MIHLKPDAGIFGLPPLDALYVSKHVVIESMPIVEIRPCVPNFSMGMTLFTMDEDEGAIEYDKILNNLEYSVDHTDGIKCAYLADSFPTDNFANDYGETFLQGMTDFGSKAISDIMQMTGKTHAGGALGEIGGEMVSFGKEMDGLLGGGIEAIGSGAIRAKQGIETLRQKMDTSPNTITRAFGGGLQMVDKMLAGNRVDFPQV